VSDRNNLVSPDSKTDAPGFIAKLFRQLEQILNGRTRNQGAVTLTANAATTVINNPLFESHQAVVLSPLTANAAAAIATTYVSARTAGQFTLAHANNAQVDKSFEYIFVG